MGEHIQQLKSKLHIQGSICISLLYMRHIQGSLCISLAYMRHLWGSLCISLVYMGHLWGSLCISLAYTGHLWALLGISLLYMRYIWGLLCIRIQDIFGTFLNLVSYKVFKLVTFKNASMLFNSTSYTSLNDDSSISIPNPLR